MMYELTSKFLSKFKIGVLYTILVFAVFGIVDSVSLVSVPLYIIFLYVLLPVYTILFLLEVIWRVKMSARSFSGQIKSYNDVDDFLANYKYFTYSDDNTFHVYKHLILNSIAVVMDGCRLKILTPGVYAWHRCDSPDFLFTMIKVQPWSELRDTVWQERKYINLKLRADRIYLGD